MAGNRNSISKDHQYQMAHEKSNGHVTDDVM